LGRVTIAIDGGEDTGWSKWLDRRLVACGLCHPDDYPELPFIIGLPPEGLDLIIELPEDYGSNRGKVDPNSLIFLATKCGEIRGVYRAYYHLLEKPFIADFVLPKRWKGQVPKNIHHDRHLPRLDAVEKTVLQESLSRVAKGKRHNIKDGVCLGMWRVKR